MHDETRDGLILAWKNAEVSLKAAKQAEIEARQALLSYAFAGAPEGTHNIELGNGWKLKAVVKMNYSLNDKDGATEKVCEQFPTLSNEAAFIADRLVKWKPELSVSEYKKLSDEGLANGQRMKALVDSVLTIKPGQGTVELVEPKATT